MTATISGLHRDGPPEPRRPHRDWLCSPFLPLATVVAAIVPLAIVGIGDVERAARHFPFDILAIFVALELFTSMVIGTGVANVIAVRLARYSRGQRASTLVASVVVLFGTCTLGNNLTHVGLILPILLVLLRTLSIDRRYFVAYFACVMAVVNLAGASTPVGDFPALTIMASGITSFTAYLVLAFPLFALLTGAAILGTYLLASRSRSHRDADGTGVKLLEARYRHAQVDTWSLVVLLVILAGMFVGWVCFQRIPAWVIAWSGTAIGTVLAPRVRHMARIDAMDLHPVLKIGAFLAGAGYLSTTGLLELMARLMQNHFHTPEAALVALMLVVTIMTAFVSAGPTAAALLPLAQNLVASGAVLAGQGDLVAVAFAGAICAGSSAFLWSATAGPLIARRVTLAGIRDTSGRPMAFTARDYLPWGILNATIQLIITIAFTLVVYMATKA
jgi:Na+/H+ antiporter NhaD/arsenite permease-like protein